MNSFIDFNITTNEMRPHEDLHNFLLKKLYKSDKPTNKKDYAAT